MKEDKVIYETDLFYVLLLDDSEKVDAGQNYGVVNKEFLKIDARTESEMAARFICDQFEHSKSSSHKEDSEKFKLTAVSNEGVH